MSEAAVQVFIPAGATTDMELGLVRITEAIHALSPDDVAHGCLGGEFGYGAYWSNDVFEMRPYYWGECTCDFEAQYGIPHQDFINTLEHERGCYQVALRAAQLDAGVHYSLESRRDLGYQEIQKREKVIYRRLTRKYGLSKYGCAVHCTCSWDSRLDEWEAAHPAPQHAESCEVDKPNFLHRPSGLRIEWYKWIGRSMEMNFEPTPDQWASIEKECLESLGRGKGGRGER
jgi:hypothetical protein